MTTTKPKPKKKARARGAGEGTIAKRKDGRYMGGYTVGTKPDGKQDRRWVYGATREEAAQKLNEKLYEHGKFGKATVSHLTVGQVFSSYVALKKQSVSYSTLQSYGHYLKLLLPDLGEMKVQDLTPLTLEKLYAKLATTHSASTRKHLHNFITASLERMVRSDLLPQNVARKVSVPAAQIQPVAQSWTSEQVTRFLEQVRGHRLYPLFYLSVNTGMRVGELIGLRWPQLNLEAATLEVVATRTRGEHGDTLGPPKKGKKRLIFIPESAVLVLREHQVTLEQERQLEGWAEGNWVFPAGNGSMLSGRNLTRFFKAQLEVAGLKEIRMHDLRHTHTSLAIRGGQDPKMVADRLGHTSVALTLQVYRHVYDEERREASLDLEVLLERAKVPAKR